MHLSGEHLEHIQRAFEDAFRTPSELARMVKFKLGYDLSNVAGGENLSDTIFQLIRWAESAGLINKLVIGALNTKPGNTSLRACADFLESYSEDTIVSAAEILPTTEVVAALRRQVSKQIERYARSKYIKGLYVNRELERDLEMFHSSEQVLAQHAKTIVLEKIEKPLRLLQEVQRVLSLLEFARDRLSADLSYLGMKELHAEQLTRLRLDTARIAQALSDITSSLETLRFEAAALPEDRILHLGSQHAAFFSSAKQSASVIRGTTLYTETIEQRRQRPKEQTPTTLDRIAEQIQGIRLELARRGLELSEDPDHENYASFSMLKRLERGLMRFEQSKSAQVDVQVQDIIAVYKNLYEALNKEFEISTFAVGYRRYYYKTFTFVMGSFDALAFATLESAIDVLDNIDNEFERAIHHVALVIDRAGGGKTSLLCELAERIAVNAPVILLFGKESLEEPDSVIQRTSEAVGVALNCNNNMNPLDILDRILKPTGRFLHVIIDGINECRKIPEFDTALERFFVWASRHRIRVTVSCRDIYWVFFNFEQWKPYVYDTYSNRLNQFTNAEYDLALGRYFEHFYIDCKLIGSARLMCHHPLLLRFFCEAYGSSRGPMISLGVVQDIRLKELFDEYFERKMEQARAFLRHKNADVPARFLLDLAQYMYANRETSVVVVDIERATRQSDTSTEASVYLRLLDEDIIIEEEPTDNVYSRKVRFVYEEFMEYVLAKSRLAQVSSQQHPDLKQIFLEYVSVVQQWVNATGVVEYIVIMLESENESVPEHDGLSMMQMMLMQKGVWIGTFWRLVGKLPERSLQPCLFDMFYDAFNSLPAQETNIVKDALEAMSRYSRRGAEKLASALLWSAVLPNVITWQEIDQLPTMPQLDLETLGSRIVEQYRHGLRPSLHVGVTHNRLLNWVLPHLDTTVRNQIRKSIQTRGKLRGNDFRGLMSLISGTFPQHSPYLLNGILCEDEDKAAYCADQIRFVKNGHHQIAYLLRQLAEVDERPGIQEILLTSSQWLEYSDRIPRPRKESFHSEYIDAEVYLDRLAMSGEVVDEPEEIHVTDFALDAYYLPSEIATSTRNQQTFSRGTTQPATYLAVVRPSPLRAGPERKEKVIVVIPENRAVEVVDVQGNWVYAMYFDTRNQRFVGWISRYNLVKLTNVH